MEQEVKKETKICKYCKSEIPKNAKVCPVCRRKQKHIGGFVALGIVALIVVIIIASNAGNDSKPKKVGEDGQSNAAGSTAGGTGKDVFTKGEIAEMNGIQITLKDYEESSGNDFFKPDDGNVFVIVTFEIANNSDDEISVSSIGSFETYVDDYSVNISISAESVKEGTDTLDGTIAAGKKMNGIIGYEVPKDWKNMEISFTENIWKDASFKFEINK